jgi:hypothetical protein
VGAAGKGGVLRDGRPPLELFDAPSTPPRPVDGAGGATVVAPLFDHGESRPSRPHPHTAPVGSRRSWVRRYGPQFGKGLLFGRHAGVYQVHPQRETRGQQRLTDA